MIQATRADIDDGASATPPPRRRGRISTLRRVMDEMPDVYERMLSLIESGCYCTTAAEAKIADVPGYGPRSKPLPSLEPKKPATLTLS